VNAGDGGWIKRIYRMTVNSTEAWSSGTWYPGGSRPQQEAGSELWGNCAPRRSRDTAQWQARLEAWLHCEPPRGIRGGSTSGGVRPQNGVEQQRPGCQQRSSSIR